MHKDKDRQSIRIFDYISLYNLSTIRIARSTKYNRVEYNYNIYQELMSYLNGHKQIQKLFVFADDIKGLFMCTTDLMRYCLYFVRA